MLILSKYSYDFWSDAYEFKEELFIKMMMSISSFDLTLSLFYFDEEILVKLRNELKSNFRSLDTFLGYLVRSMPWQQIENFLLSRRLDKNKIRYYFLRLKNIWFFLRWRYEEIVSFDYLNTYVMRAGVDRILSRRISS